MQDISDKLDAMKVTVSQQAPPPASDSGYVIEPEGQSVKNGNSAPQVTEEKDSENVSEPTPTASGDQPEASGAPPGTVNSNVEGASTNGGSPGINGTQSGTLDSGAVSGAGGNTAAAGDGPLLNPGTGTDGYNGNPLTGR